MHMAHIHGVPGLDIGKFASLGQAIHAPSDFHTYMAFVDDGVQIVVVHDFGWQDSDGDAHVGIILRWHGCAQVEVLEVTHHAMCPQC